MRDARELMLAHQLRPAHRARHADAREIVALEVDDHHVLGGVLVVVDVLAERTRALDRLRPEPVAAPRQEELRASPRRSPSRRRRACCVCSGPSASRERARVARERRRQVLHEVHLVDVAALDRCAHLLDRRGVVVVAPGARPLADPKRTWGLTPKRGLPAAPAAMRGSGHGSSFAGVFAPYAMKTSASRPATYASSSSKLASSTTDGARGMEQQPQAELDVVDRHALVRRVDEARRDLRIHRRATGRTRTRPCRTRRGPSGSR